MMDVVETTSRNFTTIVAARDAVCTERDMLMERNIDLASKLETAERDAGKYSTQAAEAHREASVLAGRLLTERAHVADLARILHHALERGSR
jgi:phage shock protein A